MRAYYKIELAILFLKRHYTNSSTNIFQVYSLSVDLTRDTGDWAIVGNPLFFFIRSGGSDDKVDGAAQGEREQN